MRTLGIDPGSRLLGYGVVTRDGSVLRAVHSGTLRFNTAVDANERLVEIYDSVSQLLEKFQPDHVAIEKVFVAKNAVSALKLGQARGVAILPVRQKSIPLFEYSPNAIKQAVVGFGHADKQQVARMVSRLLGVLEFESSDASDALAIAICHINTYSYHSRLKDVLTRKELG